MEPFQEETGIVAPLPHVNVDTDSIVPARFLKRISRQGWGEVLFHDWRYLEDGKPNDEFVLNQPRYRGASILAVGRNFGSGSSREHAVWAVRQFGIRAIVASSLAEIFHKNCFQNGLVPVLLSDELVAQIIGGAQTIPGYRLTVDLERSEIRDGGELCTPFVVHRDPQANDFHRQCLVEGLDEIALTLQMDERIRAFEVANGFCL